MLSHYCQLKEKVWVSIKSLLLLLLVGLGILGYHVGSGSWLRHVVNVLVTAEWL